MSRPAAGDAQGEDPTPAQLAALEAQVLADPALSRLAEEWMLGNSRSLADFLTYNRGRIEAHLAAQGGGRAAPDMG